MDVRTRHHRSKELFGLRFGHAVDRLDGSIAKKDSLF